MGRSYDAKEAHALLSATPGLLRSWLSGLGEGWMSVPGGTERWSVYDIVGHLNHCERVDWIPRARQILAGRGDQPFEPVDREAMLKGTQDETLPERLDQFEALRSQNLESLKSLPTDPASLALPGLHPDFGAVNLGQLLATWVVHDLSHISQIARVMAKHYGDEVGPWKQYLPILSR